MARIDATADHGVYAAIGRTTVIPNAGTESLRSRRKRTWSTRLPGGSGPPMMCFVRLPNWTVTSGRGRGLGELLHCGFLNLSLARTATTAFSGSHREIMRIEFLAQPFAVLPWRSWPNLRAERLGVVRIE